MIVCSGFRPCDPLHAKPHNRILSHPITRSQSIHKALVPHTTIPLLVPSRHKNHSIFREDIVSDFEIGVHWRAGEGRSVSETEFFTVDGLEERFGEESGHVEAGC